MDLLVLAAGMGSRFGGNKLKELMKMAILLLIIQFLTLLKLVLTELFL